MIVKRTFGSDQPPPLTHLFEPPERHVGTFGWLCGYAADAFFLEDATWRFTGRTKRRRSVEGEVALGIVLDPGAPRISIVDVPGVLHLPLAPEGSFRLMHAKVALLGYRALDGSTWRLRLVVSTGNWTRQTLEESLDLAFMVEIGSDELDLPECRQPLVDVVAGFDFLEALRATVDDAPLRLASRVTQEAVLSVAAWCSSAKARAPADVASRFIDSRTRPLLPQIVEKIAPGSRNYLAMGSGFYEGGGGPALPSVPAAVVGALDEAGLRRPGSEVDVFVNPDGCQAIAAAMTALAEARWTVRRPGLGPFFSARNLHAKFLFGAQYDRRSTRCLHAWLYLGSGNLTRPGLLRAGPGGGNLEAGVVLAPTGLLWEAGSGGVPVKTALPISWDEDTALTAEGVVAGGEMPDRSDAFLVAPVSCLIWSAASDGTGRLAPPGPTSTNYVVLDAHGDPCLRDGHAAVWRGSCPPEATVTWDDAGARRAERVPIIDEHGRLGAAPLAPVAFGEVWSLLADFPVSARRRGGRGR